MEKRKFDELISHFNRKVADMSIDQKYKMELLGMISAIGFAHEKELGTNLASLGTDCISREQAIDAVMECYDNDELLEVYVWKLHELRPIQPEIIRCKDCKYARLTDDGSCKYCDIWFPDEAEYMDGDYYCASAERKSNE